MRDYERRLHALEVKWLAPNTPPWAMMDAIQRAVADAVRAKIARRLDGMEDTPEQAAQDAQLLEQWRALSWEREATGARERIAVRLDRMAARLQAGRDESIDATP